MKKRWLYLFAATFILLFLGLIYAWSIFKVALSEQFIQWDETQLSLTFTISMVFFVLSGFLSGRISAFVNLRYRMLISAVVIAIGFFGASQMGNGSSENALISLYVFYGIIASGGVGMCYNSLITTVAKFFPDKVGVASGTMLFGFGFGGLALGSAVNTAISHLGIWTSFKLLGVIIFVIILVGAFVIKQPYTSDNSSKKRTDEDVPELSPKEMLRSPSFWFFEIWGMLLNTAGLMIINSAANISVAFGGTVALGMIVSLFNGAGRIIAGRLFDGLGQKRTTLIVLVIMLVAGCTLYASRLIHSIIPITAGLIFVGLAYGGLPTLTSSFTNKSFGQKYFAVNFGIASFNVLPAAVIGPILSAKLMESSGGEYFSSFFAIIILAIVSVGFWVGLNRTRTKGEN